MSVFLVYAISLKGFAAQWTREAATSGRKYASVDEMLQNPDFRFAVLEGGASSYMLEARWLSIEV